MLRAILEPGENFSCDKSVIRQALWLQVDSHNPSTAIYWREARKINILSSFSQIVKHQNQFDDRDGGSPVNAAVTPWKEKPGLRHPSIWGLSTLSILFFFSNSSLSSSCLSSYLASSPPLFSFYLPPPYKHIPIQGKLCHPCHHCFISRVLNLVRV